MRIDPLGLDWYYNQTSGNLYQKVNGITSNSHAAYSGYQSGLNNHFAQSTPFLGPIPVGTYTIGVQFNSNRTGKGVLPLTPNSGTNTFGRDFFQIHGDNSKGDNSASRGCIVTQGRSIRDIIANSGDYILQVYSGVPAPAIPGIISEWGM